LHGGRHFEKPALIDARVTEKISQFEKLAPLHNKSSLEVVQPLQRQFPKTPIYAIFDTSVAFASQA
jgi:acetate kinase